MRRKILAVVLLAAAVAWLPGAALADLGYGKYLPTKDEACSGECMARYINTGANHYAFIKAGFATWCADFDRTALANCLAAWPDHKVRLYITTVSGSTDCTGMAYMPFTWCSQSVWADEGDGYWDQSTELGWNDYGGPGAWNTHAFNWSKNLKPITEWACQSSYTDGDGVPNTGDEVLDTANCTQWTCADGSNTGNACWEQASAYGGWVDDPGPPFWCDGKMECCWGAFSYCGGPLGSALLKQQAWVNVDQALVDDLTGNGRAHVFALSIGLGWKNPDTEQWDIWTDWSNVWMCTKENVGNEPHIRLMYPGDANQDGIVDGLDYNAWSLSYLQAGDWAEGDFNEDDLVDGLDYNVWSLHYLHDPGTAFAGQSVPEPACLALLALGGLLIRRRR